MFISCSDLAYPACAMHMECIPYVISYQRRCLAGVVARTACRIHFEGMFSYIKGYNGGKEGGGSRDSVIWPSSPVLTARARPSSDACRYLYAMASVLYASRILGCHEHCLVG